MVLAGGRGSGVTWVERKQGLWDDGREGPTFGWSRCTRVWGTAVRVRSGRGHALKSPGRRTVPLLARLARMTARRYLATGTPASLALSMRL